jgi:hypothetical protein
MPLCSGITRNNIIIVSKKSSPRSQGGILSAKFATGIAGVTYSNDDRMATASTTSEKSVYVTTVKSTGKWYVEFSYFTSANTYEEDEYFGAATITNTMYYPGQSIQADANGSFGVADTRSIESRMSGSSTSGSLSTWNSGTNIYMVAIDFDAKKAWLGVNGSWTSGSNPATGTSPNVFNWNGTPSMRAGARLYYNQDSITIVSNPTYLPLGFDTWGL